MLEPNQKALSGLDLTFKVDDRERAVLVGYSQSEGFHLLQKLMEEEIRELNVKLINTDGADEASIIANHRIAKGAAQFYIGFINRLKSELLIEQYSAAKLGSIEHPEDAPTLPQMD